MADQRRTPKSAADLALEAKQAVAREVAELTRHQPPTRRDALRTLLLVATIPLGLAIKDCVGGARQQVTRVLENKEVPDYSYLTVASLEITPTARALKLAIAKASKDCIFDEGGVSTDPVLIKNLQDNGKVIGRISLGQRTMNRVITEGTRETAEGMGELVALVEAGGTSKIFAVQRDANGTISQVTLPGTNNLVSGRAVKAMKRPEYQGPLVEFTIDNSGETFHARFEIARRVVQANADLKAATGKTLHITSSFRSNEYQQKLFDASQGALGKVVSWLPDDDMEKWVRTQWKKHLPDWVQLQKSAASSADAGMHVMGGAIDVGNGYDKKTEQRIPDKANWQEAQPYLEKYGFIGGFHNGIKPPDPYHFDIGRVDQPASDERTAAIKDEYCRKNPSICNP